MTRRDQDGPIPDQKYLGPVEIESDCRSPNPNPYRKEIKRGFYFWMFPTAFVFVLFIFAALYLMEYFGYLE